MTFLQQQPPLAVVRGEQLITLPDDLYIPPDALEVFLEAFSGPLDLLLYLIKRQNFNICDLPIAQITAQYMRYVELMREFKLDLAAEYLVMAAVLMEIKSRLLLPRPAVVMMDEPDPHAELMRQLQEYEQCQHAAWYLDALPRCERDTWPVRVEYETVALTPVVPEVELIELLQAFQSVLKRADAIQHHEIKREQLSIRERMSGILAALQTTRMVPFSHLFTVQEGRSGVVVTLMAVLELLKLHLIEIARSDALYAPLYVCAPTTVE